MITRPTMRYFLLCVYTIIALPLLADGRKERDLEKGWKFAKGDIADAMHPTYDDNNWQ